MSRLSVYSQKEYEDDAPSRLAAFNYPIGFYGIFAILAAGHVLEVLMKSVFDGGSPKEHALRVFGLSLQIVVGFWVMYPIVFGFFDAGEPTWWPRERATDPPV